MEIVRVFDQLGDTMDRNFGDSEVVLTGAGAEHIDKSYRPYVQ